MGLNIFQIWQSIDCIVPFAVRRDNWSDDYYTIVEKVECKKMPYGNAYGYPTIKGQYSTHYEYDSKWISEKIIPCCGCYQWTLVASPDIPKFKASFKASQKTTTNAYTIHSRLYFGKFKDKTIDEIFSIEPNYLEWAVINIDKFFLTEEAFEYLDSLKAEFKFNNQARIANNEKLNH